MVNTKIKYQREMVLQKQNCMHLFENAWSIHSAMKLSTPFQVISYLHQVPPIFTLNTYYAHTLLLTFFQDSQFCLAEQSCLFESHKFKITAFHGKIYHMIKLQIVIKPHSSHWQCAHFDNSFQLYFQVCIIIASDFLFEELWELSKCLKEMCFKMTIYAVNSSQISLLKIWFPFIFWWDCFHVI